MAEPQLTSLPRQWEAQLDPRPVERAQRDIDGQTDYHGRLVGGVLIEVLGARYNSNSEPQAVPPVPAHAAQARQAEPGPNFAASQSLSFLHEKHRMETVQNPAFPVVVLQRPAAC
jgi:hypothetical protein